MNKTIRKTGLLIAVAAALFITIVSGAAPAPRAFADGDRVCFVGDSITHGGLYHSYITLFYATRFPDRDIKTINNGISGDSASGATRRFDWDIAEHKPTVSTIMMGMNDVNRGLYGKENPDETNLASRKSALDRHNASMRKLSEQLKAVNSEIIYITPSIYDQTSTMEKENLYGVNDALEKCGEEARKLATEFNGSVVDFHGVMSRVNAEYQKADPKRTIVGGDRVHPHALGHLVMAYTFLKAQKISPCVSQVVIDSSTGKLAESRNVKVSELVAKADEVRFSSIEKALPFPIPSGSEGALELVPFVADLNQETLAVRGLSKGIYTLTIDDVAVGEYTAEALEKGINLAENTKTPQYKQAQSVAKANAKRHSLVSGKLRSFVHTEIYLKSQKDLDMNNFKAIEDVLNARVAKMKEKKLSYAGYYAGQTKIYLKEKPKEAEYIRQIEEAEKVMETTKTPVKHQFVLKRK
ncbi:MAG: SGNH/GDSL hydrolase family protein [Kiritimatiellae bacterium]|jgi:lysophospholipase L1-like esterase|nr:SGNH/GDSL hydrolase family protein [Kiritimatiellia bacterium]